MAIPVLKLNLAPPPTLWRRQHALLSWSLLGLGALALTLTVSLTWRAYRQADVMGRSAFQLSRQTQEALARQGSIQAQLRSINVQKELPRWKLAERILAERSIPWSRLTAELERSLVQDVRIRTLQRSRGSDQQVAAKLKGEARSREAEAAFVESIQKNPFFSQVILERESERQGGGIEFEYTLPVAAVPPPYTPLPKFGPARTQASAKVVQLRPGKPVVASKPTPRVTPAKPAPVLEPPHTAVSPPPVSAHPEPSPESPSPRPRTIRERRPRFQERLEKNQNPGESNRPAPEVRP